MENSTFAIAEQRLVVECRTANLPQVSLGLPGLAFTLFHVDTSECRPSGSVLVARSVSVRIDHGSIFPYEGLLRILSYFRFHLFGVNAFVPSVHAGIKPGYESGGLSIRPLGKRD